MNKVFGEDGFGLYHLPSGQQISPEEFGEFESAYQSLTETRKYSDDIRTAVENARKPIVFLEGDTDRKYFQKACELFGKNELLEQIDLREGGGSGNLQNAWKGFNSPLSDVVPQKELLLFDCENQIERSSRGNLCRCKIPFQTCNPIEKGIENPIRKTHS